MTITYYINNATPDLVKTVMLRKFFQMVFIGNNRQTLHVYTASVIGGRADTELEPKAVDPCSTSYVSRLDDLKAFRMRFDFVVRGNDNNDVLSIKSENITDEEQGFLSQIEHICQIWGDECEVIQDNQAKLDDALREYLPSDPDKDVTPVGNEDQLEKWGIASSQTAGLARQKILRIRDKKKEREGEMFGLAVAGEFQQKDYNRPPDCKKGEKVPEGSECASYCIQVPQGMELVPGIELVNWVKTTIRFRYRFHDSNLNFCIQKKAKSETGVQYIAPDFTWYFSPPIKTFINNESSSVEIKLVTDSTETTQECKYRNQFSEEHAECGRLKCTCPVKKLGNLDRTTERYPNAVNPVANKTTVHFKQWTDGEMISYRQKYRLAVKNIFTRSIKIDNISEINIFLDTTDEHGRGNRQFVLGLFISFALAFGIDTDRLLLAAAYFPFPNFLEADAWWLILLILLSLNILIRPPRVEKEHDYYMWRSINLIGTLGWIACVFVALRSQLLLAACAQWQSNVEFVVRCVYFIPFGSNFLYVLFNIKRYHDPILSSLFRDDIL